MKFLIELSALSGFWYGFFFGIMYIILLIFIFKLGGQQKNKPSIYEDNDIKRWEQIKNWGLQLKLNEFLTQYQTLNEAIKEDIVRLK